MSAGPYLQHHPTLTASTGQMEQKLEQCQHLFCLDTSTCAVVSEFLPVRCPPADVQRLVGEVPLAGTEGKEGKKLDFFRLQNYKHASAVMIVHVRVMRAAEELE